MMSPNIHLGNCSFAIAGTKNPYIKVQTFPFWYFLRDYQISSDLYHVSFSKMTSSVDLKLLKATKFPAEFSQKVDMSKVNVEVMKK